MPADPPPPSLHPALHPPLRYPAVRMRWCGQALAAFARRWGVHLLVAAAVAGAGTVGFVQIIGGVAAWLVLPLLYAAGHGAWLAPAVAAQALLGAGCVWGTRSLLWPPHWGESERALPIAPSQRLLSDITVTAVALVPLGVLYAFGLASVLAHDPPWLRSTRGLALGALLAAVLSSVALGVAVLQRLRRPTVGRAPTQDGRVASAPIGAPALRVASGPVRWPRALVWLALRRGPARRTGRAALWGATALLLPVAALGRWPAGVSWCLAATSVLALAVAGRVGQLARLELAPLVQACDALPLSGTRVLRAGLGLALLPPGLGLAGLAAVLALGPPAGFRLPVFAAWVAVCAGCCAIEVLAAPTDAQTRSGRWLVSLVLCICLATEVLA